MARLVAVLIFILMAGCAGVAVPIGAYDHEGRDAAGNTVAQSPRERAMHFLKLWDASIQNIQHANSTAQATLPAIAGGAAYRAAASSCELSGGYARHRTRGARLTARPSTRCRGDAPST